MEIILQDANRVNKNGNMYTKGCSKKAVENQPKIFKFDGWQEVTKEQIDIAMLIPGEYKEKDGKFYIKQGMLDGYICDEYYELYKEEVKTIVVNDAMDLFPEDPDIEETKFNRPVNKLTDYDKITEAKKVLREAFDSDEQFKWGYIHSVTMHLHDELCKDDVELKINRRNEIAEKMLKVIFYLGE